MKEQKRLEHLNCTFPKLTEENQFYVLGLTEGLKYAQERKNGKGVGKMTDGKKLSISLKEQKNLGGIK